ncbi:BLUF domain-containing protein [Marinimicrobium agarilyticum]|uniref:BLUF domain-containing protein n=1 Tax=Marinimicrobium agarilyticum TaxID=306546 RepID=UPI0004033C24|nr:BLUF domain-containing protein [Marinimicrobium agarilyticum]
MVDLVQVVYISRATFKPAAASGGVEPHVARILQQSRTNNPRLGLGGVLYYGNGYFFQCLEGDRPVVEELLGKLKKDERHKDVRIVMEQKIQKREFTDWSMKYIPSNATVKGLLSRLGYKSFNPYEFDDNAIRKLLSTLQELRSRAETVAPKPSRPPVKSVDDTSPLPYILAGGVVLVCGVLVAVLVL